MKLEESSKYTKYRYSFWIVVSLICGYVGWVLLSYYVGYTDKIVFPHYIVISFIFSGIAIFLLKQNKSKELTKVLIVLLGFYYILFLPFFSPIDEGAHFDYILHIIQQHRLPTLYDVINSSELSKVTSEFVPSNTQYEAVQPPFYYLVSSLFAMVFQKNLILSVLMLRVLGIVFILLTYYFVQKTYQELVSNGLVQKDDYLFNALSLLFFLNPGFMTRMITISNEQLVVFLMTVLIYYLVKILDEQHTSKHLICLSLISAAMILTKFTSIYIVGIVILFYFLSKEIKQALAYCFSTALFVSPWFIFNLYHYKELTGNNLHVAFVKAIVNPNNIQLTPYFILQRLNFFLGSFWNPQESGFPTIKEPYYTITNLLSLLLIGTLVLGSTYTIKSLRNLENSKVQLIILLISSIFLNIIILCYGTISQDVDIMIGRYIYMNLVSFVILTIILTQKTVIKNYRHFFGRFLLMLVCCLIINFMLDTAQSRQNFATKVQMSLLEERISFENYHQKKYNMLFDAQNLAGIPRKLGEGLNAKLDISSAFKPEIFHYNNISLTNINQLTIIGADPFLAVSIIKVHSVDTGDLIKLTLGSVQNDGRGQLFWDDGTGFSENKSIRFSISKGFHSYIIPVGESILWMESQRILGIRLDLDGYSPNDTFSLKEFMLTKATD